MSLSGSPHPVAEGVVVDLGVWHATFTASDNGFLIFQRGSAWAQTRMEWVDRNGKHLDFVGDKDVFLGPRLSYRQGMIGFDVSPDGQKFLLVIAAAENSRPLTLLQNWPRS